jgi:hypothetical protein
MPQLSPAALALNPPSSTKAMTRSQINVMVSHRDEDGEGRVQPAYVRYITADEPTIRSDVRRPPPSILRVKVVGAP